MYQVKHILSKEQIHHIKSVGKWPVEYASLEKSKGGYADDLNIDYSSPTCAAEEELDSYGAVDELDVPVEEDTKES